MRCAGYSSYYCGGYDRMMVYEIKYYSPSPSPDYGHYDYYEYQGCYYDSKYRRVMDDRRTSKRPMSAQVRGLLAASDGRVVATSSPCNRESHPSRFPPS